MCKCKPRKRKFAMTQDPGNAGAWTIVEIVRRPLFVVSDSYQAQRMIRAMVRSDRKEGRR